MSLNPSKEKPAFARSISSVSVDSKTVPEHEIAGMSSRSVKTILATFIEFRTGKEVEQVRLNENGSMNAVLTGREVISAEEWANIRRGMISTDKIAPVAPPCPSAAEEATRTSFKGARETLMHAYGASPAQVRATIDPFEDVPPPDWYEQVKVRAVGYKIKFGTVRTKHLMAVAAGVQAISDLRFMSDGAKRGEAFVRLMEADLAIRTATGKCLDVKAEPVGDGDDLI